MTHDFPSPLEDNTAAEFVELLGEMVEIRSAGAQFGLGLDCG